MSLDASPRRAAPPPTRQSSSPLVGTLTLLRLNLRLDRLRITVWTLAIALSVWASVVALIEAYPDQTALDARAALLDNPAAIMMTGPLFALDNYTLGAMVANELLLYVLVPSAIMGILLMVRHTRAEEESGRLELVRSGPVGRFAPPVAASLTVLVASLLVGLGSTLALVASDMTIADSLAFGAVTSATALVFAAVAAVTSQLTEHARSASGLALAVLAVAFLVRGIGDVIESQGSWVSWLSPLAWAQQTRLWVDLRWWPLLVSLAATGVLIAVAVALSQRRDLGAGLRPPRPGPARATRSLVTPAGLAWRLLRGSLAAWAVGAFLFGAAMGALADSIHDAVADIPMISDVLGVGDQMVTAFAGLVLSMLLLVAMVFAVTTILRLRNEEETGRIEQLLAAGHSRPSLLAGWAATAMVQAVLLTLVIGLGTGLGVQVALGDPAWLGRTMVAALLHLPAIAAVLGLALAVYGAMPRLTGVVWGYIVLVAVALFLGPLLQIPDMVMDLSVLTHVPLPGGDVDVTAQLVLLGIGAGLTIIGFIGFRRRDLAAG